MLAVLPPMEPMLAKLHRDIPVEGTFLFEQKWDGFRALAFIDGGDVDLRSRNDRKFSRYFPEVVTALAAVGADVVLDGELLAQRDGAFDFPALLGRLHPAASRVERLADETPALYVAFDLIAVGDEDLRSVPFRERRRRLEEVLGAAPPSVRVAPATVDAEVARRWLDEPAPGVDGVVAKPLDLRYQPGKRAMVKIKRDRTADAVVAGVRLHRDGGVGSMLLGLHDHAGTLRHIGIAGGLSATRRREVSEAVAPHVTDLRGHPWEHGFALEGGATGRLKGSAGRWTPDMSLDWLPVDPVLVVEVAFDQLDGIRFRHPGRFRRWRPDRDPASCTTDQLDGSAPAAGDER